VALVNVKQSRWIRSLHCNASSKGRWVVEPSEALGKANQVDGVGLGNVIGMQGFWNMVWRWHTHLKMQGASRSLQYIGLGSFLWKHLQRA
jgi:hypothetical protein